MKVYVRRIFINKKNKEVFSHYAVYLVDEKTSRKRHLLNIDNSTRGAAYVIFKSLHCACANPEHEGAAFIAEEFVAEDGSKFEPTSEPGSDRPMEEFIPGKFEFEVEPD